MDLFAPIAPASKWHPIFAMLCRSEYVAERAVLEGWAQGFVDRDGKFAYEFQTTFEPCLWELYVHAFLRSIGATIDFSQRSPDFVARKGIRFCVEATIAAPPCRGTPPYGKLNDKIPDDFGKFNAHSTIRICNSFTSKVERYRVKYSQSPHVRDNPFVIAIASFDQPFSHFAASRPIMTALYGVYFDEDATMRLGTKSVVRYQVEYVNKAKGINIPLGYFSDKLYSEVSAVIYSSLATWGKVRALADNPGAPSVYTSFHPNSSSILPIVRRMAKADYKEHLLDGLYVFHNPYADHPLGPDVLAHERVAHFYARADGAIDVVAPDDFLLMRFLNSLVTNPPSA